MTRRPSITSASNPRLKSLRRLRVSRHARTAGLFLVEGHRQVRCALEGGAVVRELYSAPELHLGPRDAALVSLAERRGARVVELGAEAYAAVAGRARLDGLLAVVERWPTALDPRLLADRALLVVADGVERPGNLGTIVRTACGAGATGLVVCDSETDLFHPDSVAGSVGALFRLPVAETTTERAIDTLHARGSRIVVATPCAAAPYWEADYAGPVAVVVGSERHGVDDRWLAAADAAVSIPMTAAVDSLNVAVAAGIVVFEAVRQRRGSRAPVATA